jgi:hypothetical protein
LKQQGQTHYLKVKKFSLASAILESKATMPVVSLADLQRQITERERELQALREELQSRQSQVSELTRRKEALLKPLQQVEQEIAALAAATTATAEEPESAAPTTPAETDAKAHAEGQPRLRDLIVTILHESRVPMTARQLCAEGQRRGYEPTGSDPVKTIKARLQDLKSEGIVRRASGQPGYLLASSDNGVRKAKSKPRQPAATSTRKTPSKPTQPIPDANKGGGKKRPVDGVGETPGEQPSLREVLTNILTNSRKPLTTRELADQILATGYHSDSKNFVIVVGIMLSKMKNVERVLDKGYRLKKK